AGRQRARKGCRFKRFPPVLFVQLKRFMFDVERMDMCKLNGRLEFPTRLDLEALAPGSGTYSLHSVVVHSGSVSDGHYYAFARLRAGATEQDCQWVKFNDELVTHCSEQAAVEDNYGGEDPQLWDYFQLPPDQLVGARAPTAPKIHSAYMLSYVREDHLEEILAAPLLDEEEGKYRAMVERCAREARQAEERRRARIEMMAKVEVKLLLERDLCKLQGFWSHDDLPCFKKLQLTREYAGVDLWKEVEKVLGINYEEIALFCLHQRKTKQTRFTFLNPKHSLHAGCPNNGEPPSLVVLCVVSRGYDPHTLEWAQPSSPEVPHSLFKWSDQLCLLIVKYFCPTTECLLTLGCHYCHVQDTLESMVTENWLQDRLRPHVEREEIAPLDPNAELMCWEEFRNDNPDDILARNIGSTVEKEGLYSGDVVVWQPVPPGSEAGDLDADGDPKVLSVKDLCAKVTSQAQVVVRLHSPVAPWCPDGVAADGRWGAPGRPAGDAQEGAAHEGGGGAEGGAPPADTEVESQEMTVDIRWTIGAFWSRVASAFGLAGALEEGRSLWLFDRGRPSWVADSPAFSPEALAVAGGGQPTGYGDRPLSEFCPRPHGAARPRWVFHAVLLPRPPPAPAVDRHVPGGWRPVALHFFDAGVREVGAAIVHVPEPGVEEEEEAGPAPERPAPAAPGDDDQDSESGADVGAVTGRPAVDPAEVLELAGRHLAANPGLLARMLPAGLPPPKEGGRRGPGPAGARRAVARPRRELPGRRAAG
ncbi:unnamed protein product, partial [Prorocentrum cordatum]